MWPNRPVSALRSLPRSVRRPEHPISDVTYCRRADTASTPMSRRTEEYLVVCGRQAWRLRHLRDTSELVGRGSRPGESGWPGSIVEAYPPSLGTARLPDRLLEDSRSSNGTGIYGSFVTPSGTDAPEFPISTAPSSQGHPDVAWNGSKYFVSLGLPYGPSWIPSMSSVPCSEHGAGSRPERIPIATSEVRTEPIRPSSSVGSAFLVVFRSGRRRLRN